MDEKKYGQLFEIRKIHAKSSKLKKNINALEKAHEIRKFEIELYWKRTAYFWTIIAAIFAGFFLMASKKDISNAVQHDMYLSLIAITGFIFSFAWFLVNKGSKFWQENWEYHIDFLENEITGPLYKTVLYRQDNSHTSKLQLPSRAVSSESISVSKVNQAVALFTMTIWAALLLITTSLVTSITSSILLYIIASKIYKHCKTELSSEKDPALIKAQSRKTTLNN